MFRHVILQAQHVGREHLAPLDPVGLDLAISANDQLLVPPE